MTVQSVRIQLRPLLSDQSLWLWSLHANIFVNFDINLGWRGYTLMILASCMGITSRYCITLHYLNQNWRRKATLLLIMLLDKELRLESGLLDMSQWIQISRTCYQSSSLVERRGLLLSGELCIIFDWIGCGFSLLESFPHWWKDYYYYYYYYFLIVQLGSTAKLWESYHLTIFSWGDWFDVMWHTFLVEDTNKGKPITPCMDVYKAKI